MLILNGVQSILNIKSKQTYCNLNQLLACWIMNVACFLPSVEFFQSYRFQKILSGITIRVSNNLDPDQARHFIGPDLGSNCLQRLSADNTSR